MSEPTSAKKKEPALKRKPTCPECGEVDNYPDAVIEAAYPGILSGEATPYVCEFCCCRYTVTAVPVTKWRVERA